MTIVPERSVDVRDISGWSFMRGPEVFIGDSMPGGLHACYTESTQVSILQYESAAISRRLRLQWPLTYRVSQSNQAMVQSKNGLGTMQ